MHFISQCAARKQSIEKGEISQTRSEKKEQVNNRLCVGAKGVREIQLKEKERRLIVHAGCWGSIAHLKVLHDFHTCRLSDESNPFLFDTSVTNWRKERERERERVGPEYDM